MIIAKRFEPSQSPTETSVLSTRKSTILLWRTLDKRKWEMFEIAISRQTFRCAWAPLKMFILINFQRESFLKLMVCEFKILGPQFSYVWRRSNDGASHNIHPKRRLSDTNYYFCLCQIIADMCQQKESNALAKIFFVFEIFM